MNTKNLLRLLFLLTAMILLVLPKLPASSQTKVPLGQVISSGQAESRHGTVYPKGPFHSTVRKTPPDPQPKPDEDEGHDEPRLDPPVDPSARPEDIRPVNAPTIAKPILETTKPTAPQAPGTFALYRNTSLASTPVLGGVTLNGYTPIEPSGAANGRVIFYTTNSYAAISGDSGQTFSYINPFDNFPADGTNDPINGGFGGDQYVYYERTRGLMFWLLQYNPDTVNNTYRLCVARSQSDVVNNNFLLYDFVPAQFGFTVPPAGANGFWMDFPDMAVSDTFLYLTANVFPRVLPNPGNPCAGTCPTQACPAGCVGGCTSTCSALGAIVWRIPLNELAQGGGIDVGFYTDTNSGYRLTQGAHGTMYWGSHNTTAQVRIYRWADNSGSLAFDNISHTAYNAGTMTATGPDGNNFAGNADSRITGAWVAGGVIGFMWNAAQGGGFAYPHVEVVRFNESNRSLLSQGQVFSVSFAFLYPSVQVNDRGHLGGTMAWGGGTVNPNALAWIADDFNNNTIAPLENVTFASGTAAPIAGASPTSGTGCNSRWGDYYTTRIHSPYGNTWCGVGYVLNNSDCFATTANARDPHYVWFGRERDTPPAANTIYVDKLNTSRYEDGTLAHPYGTFAKGNFACSASDTLMVRAGNYNEIGTFNRAATVQNLGGTVKLGAP